MMFTTSRYTITVPLHRGRRLAYNSLSGSMAIWEAEESRAYDALADKGAAVELPGEILTAMEYGGFIVREDIDELSVLRGIYEQSRFNPNVMTLTIAPTLACNFGCDYCFQGQDKPGQSMGIEVQDAIVDYVRRAAPNIKQLGIAWYGGEPTLRMKIIESLSDRMLEVSSEYGLTYDAMIVTNGYMLSPEVVQSLYQRKVASAQITLDGTPEYHDSRRYLLSKKGTFERIIKNLRAAVDLVPMQFHVRVNIDDRNREDIFTLIDMMAAEGLGGRKNLKMYFAPVEAMTEGCHAIEDSCMSKMSYGQLEAELYRYGYQKGLCALPYPPRFHGTCAAVRPKGLVIIPTGELHKCWDTVNHPHRSIGSILNVDAIDKNELMWRWLRWTPFDNETCRNCKILPNCAGACAYKFIHTEVTRGEAAVLPCPSWKYNMKERLLIRAQAMGALTVEDYDPTACFTDPTELCADVNLGGKSIPERMQEYYAEQKKRLKRRLTVLQDAEAGP